MSIKEIKELPVKNIIDKDAACFLWVTDSHLKE
jgi:N6-adenosine-specific RNA methylase IME4